MRRRRTRGSRGGSGARSPGRSRGGRRGSRRRRGRPTSWSCSSTTSATPTSAATAARSPRRTSTPSPRGASGTRTSTSRRCARRPGRRCSPGSNRHRGRASARRPLRPRLPRLRHGAGRRRGDGRGDLPRRRLRHAHGRQVAPGQGLRPDAAGAQHSWPCQRGFDRFYGFLDAFTNLHHPHRLVEDNHLVEVDRYPDGYYLTDDLTDRAISMIRGAQGRRPRASRSSSTSPTAPCHAPLHAKADDIAALPAAATTAGWDDVRRGAFAPPAGARRRPDGHRAGAAQHRAEPRRPAVGRPRRPRAGSCSPGTWRCSRAWSTTSTRTSAACSTACEELGELDNTIVVFTSDNGASREGEVVGHQRLLRPPAARATTSTPTSPAST